ncbi:MAG: ATP-dependent sacrificial sulfur transferase LarE [Candidatus Omnitrophica bacterium]|nr:ATP-dependent sacrificial sulfur transferase LarE [Candidatus Omnitrophota bacterium]
MGNDLREKVAKLKSILQKMDSVLVAYSGGVDSTFLLKIACDVLGKDKVLAVTADSATYPKSELNFAKKMAARFGAKHLIIKTNELHNPEFTNNPVNRCYYCKRELFSQLKKIARSRKMNYICDAAQISDNADFRPGDKAKKDLGIRSPLREVGFTKEEIRKLSRKFKLPTWNMPSQACLASRFPYGTKITETLLARVEKAETLLKNLGFSQVRVRHYDSMARIEVERQKIPLLVSKLKGKQLARIKNIGYKYITVDLEGYRTGSLNEEMRKI